MSRWFILQYFKWKWIFRDAFYANYELEDGQISRTFPDNNEINVRDIIPF
jgi:hypothetical protein